MLAALITEICNMPLQSKSAFTSVGIHISSLNLLAYGLCGKLSEPRDFHHGLEKGAFRA